MLDPIVEYTSTKSIIYKLEKLQIGQCAVHPNIMEYILSHSSNLRVFEYGASEPYHWPWHAESLRQICCTHTDTVSSMSTLTPTKESTFPPTAFVGPRGGSPFDGNPFLSDGVLPKPFKSFSDYNSLRTLRVTLQVLLDLATSRAPDEFLPRRLEVLHFTYCDELVIPHLEILISNLSNTMSKFEKIRIDPWNLKIAWRYQQDDENLAFGHRGGKVTDHRFEANTRCLRGCRDWIPSLSYRRV